MGVMIMIYVIVVTAIKLLRIIILLLSCLCVFVCVCVCPGANIVVDSTGQVAKLCDFGLALKMPVPTDAKAQGTIPFMAPEVISLIVVTGVGVA